MSDDKDNKDDEIKNETKDRLSFENSFVKDFFAIKPPLNKSEDVLVGVKKKDFDN